jgi:uncharacterized protein YabE (DUF348 family)
MADSHASPDTRLRNHPFIVPVITFLVLFFISLVAFINFSGTTIGASDSRVVHVSMNGTTQVVPTRAATVGELLNRMDIHLTPKDIVEPSADTQILEDDFRINVYKARPVTVIDGNHKVTTLSAAPTPEAVAASAGIEVHREDNVKSEPKAPEPADVMRNGLVAETVVIDRATPATINLYGNVIPVRSHAQTVGDVLKEKNIKVVSGDTLKPSPDTPLEPNTQIFIVRVGKQIDTREEAIPAPVETVSDPNTLAGSTVVKEPGTPGKKLVTYEVDLTNGKETSRKVLQEVISVEPIKQVVVKGTKVIYSNPSANVALGQQIAAQMGLSDQFSCIYQIFQRESKWNHLAVNRSTGAYGIPQALPGSKMGPGWDTDPAVQIRWGIGYMVSRYGSPCAANNFWQVNGWY